MKKKNFLLAMILISITFFSLDKIKAAQGSWYGDYCTSCGTYGVAGECDKVKYTDVGLFRVTFYLNGEKIGSSVNISSNQTYADLAKNASYSWNSGKTDIVTYAKGAASLNLTSGGIETIIVNGIATYNVQSKLSPKKNSATVQRILNAAGITNFSFKNGKIYYKPSNITSSDEVCDYQIQMVVEAMQVINWLCTSDGNDSYRWVGTPYELNNGLRQLEPSYNSSAGGNGWYSGSVVDKYLLSALRLNEDVAVSGITFKAVQDCLTIHIRGYNADVGYGMNIYDLTGEFICEPTDDNNVCTYIPGEAFNIECCEDENYLNDYASYNHQNPDTVYGQYCSVSVCYFDGNCDDITKLQQCCDDDSYIGQYKLVCGDSNVTKYCDSCPPLTLEGNATCTTATCEFDENSNMSNVSIFKDPVFNAANSSIKNLINEDGSINLNLSEPDLQNIAQDLNNNSFLAVAYQGETYKQEINTYCDLYCQEIAVVTLPDFSPAANAGRYFQWYITDEPPVLIKQQVTRICAEDIKLDDFIEDYYEWMKEIQEKVDVYVNDNMTCGDSIGGPIYNYKEAFGGPINYGYKCNFDRMCAFRDFPPCTIKHCNYETAVQNQQCAEENKACAEKIVKTIEGINYSYNCCMVGCKENNYISFEDVLTAFHSDFVNAKHSFSSSFETFLDCFNEELGTEIETNLQFDFDAGNIGNYFAEDSFSTDSTDSSTVTSSDFTCVNGKNCDGSYYSYKPNIEDYNQDDGRTMTCAMDYWASSDLVLEEYGVKCEMTDAANKKTEACGLQAETNCNPYDDVCKQNQYYLCMITNNDMDPKDTDIKDINEDGKISFNEQCESWKNACIENRLKANPIQGEPASCNPDDEYYNYTTCENAKFDCGNMYDSMCESMPSDVYIQNGINCTIEPGKMRNYSVPNFVEKGYINGERIDINNFPLTISDFDSSTSEWVITETAQDYNPANINWFKTFRLLTQTKTDSYTLNDDINACVCSDGTVGNLISAEEGRNQGLEVSGDYYCDCDIEESNDEYYNSTSDESSSIVANERWGMCKYSGYATISEGGNYSIKYMSGSGSYPLSIYYWNIGSIDLDGDAHFNDMLDNCGCPGGECEYSGDACKLFVGNAIMSDSWSYENTKWWDLSASYYVCTPDGCEPPEQFCPDGDCPPEIDIIPNCPECDTGDEPAGLATIYRTVDLGDPFPDRNAGANWLKNEEIITNNRGVSGNELYSSNLEPLYTFKFTPDVIKDIRAFNNAYGRDYASSSTIAYPDNQMTKKNDEGNIEYTKGISQVLNNELIVYFENAAAANNDDLDEWFDVPLIKSCEDYLDDTGYSYCKQINDSSFVIISGDDECWTQAQILGGGQ